MDSRVLLYLCIGTFAMLIPMLVLGWTYRIQWWKIAAAAVLLTVSGTLSTNIWYFIENGRFDGRSFYGAVFLVPLIFIPVAKLLRMEYGKLLDLSAPSECVMLTLMKYICLTEGCCIGKVLSVTAEGVEVRFPSQLSEAVFALLLAVALILLARNAKNQGKLFPWYMVIYGAGRFVLNLFRETDEAFLFGLPAGNVWSIVSVAVGAAWLYFIARKRNTQTVA